MRQRTQSEHERITAMLSAYLDDELTAKERQHLEGHLAQCDACAEDLRTLRYTKALLVEAPALRIPRSFVVRRADLEAPAAKAPRRLFGLSTGLAYAYLRGATALVAVAFAVLVASDLFGQISIGVRQSGMMVEKEMAAEVTVVVEEAVKEELATEATVVMERTAGEPTVVQGTPVVEVISEVEKVAMPDATPSPAVRQASPPAEAAEEKAVQALAVPEAAPTQATNAADATKEAAVAKETFDAGDTTLLTPDPTVTPAMPAPLPSTPATLPPATPEPTVPVGVQGARNRLVLSALRLAEIGLGALALTLLVIMLIVRRQQP